MAVYKAIDQDDPDGGSLPAPPRPAPPPTAAAGVDWQQVMAWLRIYAVPASFEAVPEAVYGLIRAGLLPPGATATADGHIRLPSGETWAATNGRSWTGSPDTGAPPATPPSPPDRFKPTNDIESRDRRDRRDRFDRFDRFDPGDYEIDSSYLAPFTEAQPGLGIPPEFQSPGEFVAPTAADLTSDPSFLWRVDQGRGAIENSAAARGVLNSGGTLADILNYGQKAGAQEFSNVFDRKFGVWNANWGNALTKFRANKDVTDTAYDNAWRQYLDRQQLHFRNQNEPFNKIQKMASLGAMTG